MPVSGSTSLPIYTGLTLDAKARHHAFVIEGEGAAAAVSCLSEASQGVLAATTIIATGSTADIARLASLATPRLRICRNRVATLQRFSDDLKTLTMGTRFYFAGTGPFIGLATTIAMQHGVNHLSVLTQHCGALTRRVQCMHCKGITEDVTTNPVRCAHCGLHLLVRDHYSRRLAAFQGIRIDAEVPGDIPPEEAITK